MKRWVHTRTRNLGFQAGHAGLSRFLAGHGFIAADEEARELLDASGSDQARLAAMVERRLTGEPLAWITGSALFCGLWLRITPGTYVPRPHTEPVARCALELLPPDGRAIDLCTGSGAIAAFLLSRRGAARIVATDLATGSVDCARLNGVDARCGDLFDAVPADFRQVTDLVTAVVPYVPHETLHTLQRDTFTFETPQAYDGGRGGLDVLRRVVAAAPDYLKPGGHLVLELGPEQPKKLACDLRQSAFDEPVPIYDDDGDLRGISAEFQPGVT